MQRLCPFAPLRFHTVQSLEQAVAMEKMYPEIEYEDDIKFYRVSLWTKRIFIGFLYAITLAGLMGVFGYGFWTKKTVGDQNRTQVEYEYFLRLKRDTPLDVHLNMLAVQDSVIRISINNKYLEKVNMRQIEPLPFQTVVTGDESIYCFKAQPGSGRQTFSFTSAAEKTGKVSLVVRAHKQQYTINQFIYP